MFLREMNNRKICFVSPNAYPILKNTCYEFAGGAEVQQVLIAQALTENNFQVSFIVGKYGGKKTEKINNITVFKSSYEYKTGKLHYVPALSDIFLALCKANADLYFLRNPKHLLGVVAYYCQMKKRKFVFSSSIDYDSDLKHIRKKESIISRTLFLYGLRRVDRIIVQTDKQKRQFEKNFGLNSVLIKNMCPLPSLMPVKESPPVVLWVGTARENKRPQLLFELARAIPSLKFRMIIAPGRNERFNKIIKEQCRSVHNIEFLGFIPYQKINKEYARASLLVNTSRWEGFPNTFLQAWANEIPVVSLEIDPDEVICKHKLGLHSRTFEQMVKDVKLLIENEDLRREMGIYARKYVEAEHGIKKISRQYIDLFKNI